MSLLLPDLLFATAVVLLASCLGFVAFVIWDLRCQDRDEARRARARADWTVGRGGGERGR